MAQEVPYYNINIKAQRIPKWPVLNEPRFKTPKPKYKHTKTLQAE